MKTYTITDKFAASMSIICLLHCMFIPSFLIVSSGTLSVSIDNEFVHFAILYMALPVSIYALLSGLKNHKDFLIFLIGIIGLTILLITAYSEELFGYIYTIVFTFIGSVLVVSAHIRNYKMCKQLECDCHEVN